MKIHNCHTHIFTNKIVPTNFLPVYLNPIANLLRGEKTSKALAKFFSAVGKNETALLVRKYNAFINIGNILRQEDIFKHQQGFYPNGTKFVVLSMDMEFMKAGKVELSFEEQLEQLSKIKRNPDFKDVILPFIFVHPERKNIFDLVQYYIEEENFSGLKIYPPLGYYPFDSRLDKVYKYAEDNKIPVITHCSRGGVFYKGNITDDMKIHPITGKDVFKKRKKFFTDCYTDPDNYNHLLEKFPKLKINLAHFGGGDEWEKYLTVSWSEGDEESWFSKVKNLILQYDNVYTDISYTLCNPKYFNLLKVTLQEEKLRNKILYGSDFYMLEQELTERDFSINLRGFLDDKDYRQIAETNPEVFLAR